METEKICGKCKYHKLETISYGYVCVNDKSEYVADWTEYDFSCEDWESREE